jgi:hypothetical protein
MAWVEQMFKTSQGDKLVEVRGWVRERRHVGLYFNEIGVWWLVHLNSGHGICKLAGQPIDVLPVATRLAECTDWSFSDIRGWQNTDPDLPRKIGQIWAAEPRVMPEDIPGPGLENERNARALALEKMDEEDAAFAREHGS